MFTRFLKIVDIIIGKIKISIIQFLLFQHNSCTKIFEKHLVHIPCREVDIQKCILILGGGFVNGQQFFLAAQPAHFFQKAFELAVVPQPVNDKTCCVDPDDRMDCGKLLGRNNR